MIFYENRLLTDDSHEIPFLIFCPKIGKMLHNLPSAAVVIGAFRVKRSKWMRSIIQIAKPIVRYEITLHLRSHKFAAMFKARTAEVSQESKPAADWQTLLMKISDMICPTVISLILNIKVITHREFMDGIVN